MATKPRRTHATDGLPIDEIITGDCLEGMRQLPSGCIDLVFADPPFNIGFSYDQYNDRRSPREYLDWSLEWTIEAARLLKPTGALWLAIGDEYAAQFKLILQDEARLTCRNWVIWYYTFGVNCKAKFTRSHAHLLYMIKDERRFTFNPEEIRVPSARQMDGDKRAEEDGRIPDDTWILRPRQIPTAFTPGEDTWYVPRVNGSFHERQGWHGCQMPEQLLGRIIRACSHPGEIVLDPFVGSGTTPTVAKKLGRRFVGFELSAEYAERARKRLGAAKTGQPLEGPENPLVDSPRSRTTRQADPNQQSLWE